MPEITKQTLQGQLLEPPLPIRERLAAHCEYAAGTSQDGDYFHLLAKDALAEIERLRQKIDRADRYLALGSPSGARDALNECGTIETS